MGDINIIFCLKCEWKIVNAGGICNNGRANKCPKCGAWKTYEVSRNILMQGDDEVGRDFSITDNDDIYFLCRDFKDAKKIVNKAFKLFREEDIKLSRIELNKEKVKELMKDGKKKFVSEVSEKLNIHPREVREIFLSLDKEGFWSSGELNKRKVGDKVAPKPAGS